MPEQKNYRIIELRAENIKKIKAITIHPTGDIVHITGKNGHGKSSVLDCIWLALDGAEAAKKMPSIVREGQEKASVTLIMGDITISRRYVGENAYLDVYTDKGAKYPSPQAVLDKMISTIAFDPLQFTNLDSKKQVELLLQFSEISIDIPEHDRKIQKAEVERTDANRDLKKAQAVLDQTIKPANLTLAEVKPVTDLMNERKQIEAEKNVAETTINSLITNGQQYKKDVADKTKLIAELEVHLENAKKELAEAETKLADTTEKYKVNKKNFDSADFAGRLGKIDSTIADGETLRESNARISRYNEVEIGFKKAKEIAFTKEKDLNALRAQRDLAIQNAKFPIGGLGLSEEGVTFHGIPFVQCSSAERLQVGIAMVIAANPQIRVVRIQDGSLLDSESMQVIKDMGEAYDIQFWIEAVNETGKIGIVMEDGNVKADNYHPESVEEVQKPAKKSKKSIDTNS